MTFTYARALAVAGLGLLARAAFGQGGVTPPASTVPTQTPAAASAPDAVHHPDEGWSLHFQQTLIQQWHQDLNPNYAGPFSLKSRENAKLSFTSTLFIGRRLWKTRPCTSTPKWPAAAA